MKKILFLGLVLSLLFIQLRSVKADAIKVKPADQLTEEILESLGDLPSIVKETFQEKVIPIWKKMAQWFEENIWVKIKPKTRQEIEKRKRIAKLEAEKEKEELKKELEEILEESKIFEKIKNFLPSLLDI